MCSISYEPCTEQSFRIGQRPLTMDNMQDMQNLNMGLMGSVADQMMGNVVNPMMTGNLFATCNSN